MKKNCEGSSTLHFSHAQCLCFTAVGVNCQFDPHTSLQTIRAMKAALDTEGLSPYLITQPVAFHCPDANKGGYDMLPEFPFGELVQYVT